MSSYKMKAMLAALLVIGITGAAYAGQWYERYLGSHLRSGVTTGAIADSTRNLAGGSALLDTIVVRTRYGQLPSQYLTYEISYDASDGIDTALVVSIDVLIRGTRYPAPKDFVTADSLVVPIGTSNSSYHFGMLHFLVPSDTVVVLIQNTNQAADTAKSIRSRVRWWVN